MESSSTSRAELRDRLRRQEVVAEVGRRALAEDDLDSLLHDVATAVADALGTECCTVLELLPDGDEVLLRGGVGCPDDLVGAATAPATPDSPSLAALRTGEPVVAADLRGKGRLFGPDLSLDRDAISGIGAVIGSVDAPWGVLETYSAVRREFTDHEADFVRSVADVLAPAIERIQSERELAERERRYRNLVEHFPDGAVALVDEELRYSIVGGTPIDAEAATAENLEGRPVREAISDDLADVLVPRYRAALNGESSTFEHERDGTHARIRIFPVWDDGEVFAAMGVSQDVTEHRRVEQELRDSEARFRSMMERSPFSMQIFDAEGRTIEANPAWERLWDASREELDGYNVLEDEQLEAAGVLSVIRQAFAGENVRLPLTHYDPAEIGKPGRDRWIDGYAYPLLPDQETQEVAIVHHDVTDRKERERELERIRERMEFALTATDSVVWNWNVEDDDASFYPSAVSLYGTAVEDWDDFLDVVHPDDRETVRRSIERSLETGEMKRDEVRIVRDGEVRWIEAPGQPVAGDGEPTRMIGVARDITERKSYERRLKESNERLEQFAHAASHDLQEPLRMVSSYLQLIEDRYADDLDEDAEEFIDYAVDGAERMRDMIDSLLAYSRIEARGNPFEPVELDDVLDAVRRDLEVRIAESDAEIAVEGLPRVRGDPDQLRELLQNLLANALEYAGDEPPSIRVSAERDGDRCVVSVEDDGIGIDAADQETIFEVFERLHSREDHPGTGIGLALCQRIVERHGGDIWVESEPGEGATFFFALPRAPDE